MNYLRSSFAALTASLLAAHGLQAQTTATTDPVGFTTVALPAGSDTAIAAPLTKPPVFQGAVSSRSNFVITVSPSPNFSNLTATPHYVQPVTGPQAGFFFDVATNTSNTITLVDNGVTPTGLDASNTFKVVPYWTLGQVFPAGDQNVSFTPSGLTGGNRRTQILFPNIVGTGINRAPQAPFFFATNAADPTNPAVSFWRNVNTGATNQDNRPILPDSYIIVRNPTNAGTNLKLTVAGNVNVGATAVQLDSVNGTTNDNYVSLGRPTDITLDNLGLVSSGAFLPSTSFTGGGRRDQLLIYNNAQIGTNKSPQTQVFFYVGGTNNYWASTTTGTTNVGSVLIPGAIGYIVRKHPSNSTGTQFWTNNITIAP